MTFAFYRRLLMNLEENKKVVEELTDIEKR
jgi:hypothetical protein